MEPNLSKLNNLTPETIALWMPFAYRQQVYPMNRDRSAPEHGTFYYVGYSVHCLDEHQADLLILMEKGGTDMVLTADLSYVFPSIELLQQQILLESVQPGDQNVN